MKRPAVYTAAFLVVLAMLFVPASNAEAQPVQNPTNGHFYEAIAVPAGIDWATAFVAATTSTFQGEAEYLATVTSMSEHDFIVNTLSSICSSSRTFRLLAGRIPAGDGPGESFL